jgi:hypothetical protein
LFNRGAEKSGPPAGLKPSAAGRSWKAMDQAQTRRLWVTLGGGVVVLGLSLGAGFLILLHGPRTSAPPPAATAGLVVQTDSSQAALDPQKPLRCFVNGQLVGQLTLADCAQRNGVATEALDVGVDHTGQLAAADQPDSAITPLPPVEAQAPTVATDPAAPNAPVGDCLRFAGSWRQAGAGMSLSGCVKLLFDGHCQRGAAVAYGRWMGQTLRQTQGEIDTSSNNKDFHQLAPQSSDCAIADF